MIMLLRYTGLILGLYALLCLIPNPRSNDHTPINVFSNEILGQSIFTPEQHHVINSAIDLAWKAYFAEQDDQDTREDLHAAALLLMAVLSYVASRRLAKG